MTDYVQYLDLIAARDCMLLEGQFEILKAMQCNACHDSALKVETTIGEEDDWIGHGKRVTVVRSEYMYVI